MIADPDVGMSRDVAVGADLGVCPFPYRLASHRTTPLANVPTRPRRLVAALLLSLTFLAAHLVPVPSGAAPVIAAPPAAPTAAISVTSNQARPDFPDGVDFSLVATAPAPIERVELLYAVAGQQTLNLATPDFDPGRVVTVAHQVDLDDGSLPPGLEIGYHWRIEDAAGGVLETTPRTFRWEDDRFEWQTLAGKRATVHAYAGDESLARAVLDTAERTIARLETAFAARLTAPVRIWVYASADDFTGAMRANAEPWIAGAAYPSYGLVLAVLTGADDPELGRVVPHEIAHIVLHEATRNPFNDPPVWLDEGLAVHAQEVADPTFPDLVRAAAAAGRLESVRVLNAHFPYDTDGANLGYAQSESLVRFILDAYGDDAMARLIAVHRDGVTPDEAVQRALGLTLDELDARWRASLAAAPRQDLAANPPPATSGDDSGGLDSGQALALASGGLVMGAAALLAVAAGAVSLVRARRLSTDVLDADA